MPVETIITCPLGSQCEEVRDGSIHRCAWNVKMRGTDPATGEERDDNGCAMSWMPILLVENSRQQVRTTAAVESFRNESASANEASQRFLMMAANIVRGAQHTALPAAPAAPAIGG
jgi:hypothetical protein